MNAYLLEGYAVPAQQCAGVWPIRGCWIREEKDTNEYDIGSDLWFSVLPTVTSTSEVW